MWKKLRSTFLLGLLAAAPLALTIYVFIVLFRWFDQLFQPFIQSLPFFERPVAGLGVLVGILFIFSVGVVAPSIIGRQLFVLTERVMDRLPLAKLIYSGTKQIFDSFSNDSLKKFSRVVWVEFPNEGLYTIAFVTAEYPTSPVQSVKNATLAVFVPTTPNPTSGYLVFVDPRKVIPVDLTVEDALKLIISGGLVKPTQFLLS